MKTQKTIPIFRIFDEAKAKEFYIEWLGFKIDWEHRFGDNFPLYIQVSRDGLTLHLSEHHGDCSPGSKVYVVTEDTKSFYAEIAAKDYRYNKPGYNSEDKSFEVIDPFGNKLSFNESRD